MSTYKQQIKEKLIKNNWEIIQVESGDKWWIDEYWKIKLGRTSLELELFIVFKVDPQFEGIRKKGQGIWEIDALSKFPDEWNERQFSITSISMTKRKFNIKLDEFIDKLNEYKYNSK